MKRNHSHGFSLRDMLDALFRRKTIPLSVLAVVIICTLLAMLVMGRRYQSEMKILVQNARGNIVISADRTTNSAVTDVTEQQINSEIEILHSRDVLDATIDPEWSKTPIGQRTQKEVSAHEIAIKQLEDRLVTDAGRKSNIITVTYEGNTPLQSQKMLERLSAAFLAQVLHVQRPAGASSFFMGEADRYGQAWNEATQQFVDFQQAHKLVSLPDQEASLDKEVDLTKEQLRTVDASIRELEGRIAEGAHRLTVTPERQVTEQKTVPNQQSVQQLNTLTVQLENKRTSLLTQFKPDDRLVQEIDQQIAQTKSALAQATSSTAMEQTTDVNPAWQSIKTKNLQDVVSREALRQQKNALAQQLAHLQDQLAEAQSLTVHYNLLKNKADDLKENYQLYSQKRDQAQIEDAMDAQQLLNVTIAERPTLSYMWTSPKPVRSLALAVITACFLSLGLIYVVELGRPTIVTPRELEMISNHPVLATVPLRSLARPLSGDSPYYHFVADGEDLLNLLRQKRRERTFF